MKLTNIKITFLLLFFASTAFSQYAWKLSKDKDGIKIYESDITNSGFKSIKVECTLEGTYDKLLNAITDVSHHKDWVYNNKTAYIINRLSATDFYYYTETYIPWPITNRDAVIHEKINRDSLNRFLSIEEKSEPDYIPEKSGLVRVPRSSVTWYVTMPTPATISITYIFDAEPGGSIPACFVNMFVDKAPYESFKKLSELLK